MAAILKPDPAEPDYDEAVDVSYDDAPQTDYDEGAQPDYDETAQADSPSEFSDPDSQEASQEWYARKQK